MERANSTAFHTIFQCRQFGSGARIVHQSFQQAFAQGSVQPAYVLLLSAKRKIARGLIRLVEVVHKVQQRSHTQAGDGVGQQNIRSAAALASW